MANGHGNTTLRRQPYFFANSQLNLLKDQTLDLRQGQIVYTYRLVY